MRDLVFGPLYTNFAHELSGEELRVAMILFNNHLDSGNAACVHLPSLAGACGYRRHRSINQVLRRLEFIAAIKVIARHRGPTVQMLVNPGFVSYHHRDNLSAAATAFRAALQGHVTPKLPFPEPGAPVQPMLDFHEPAPASDYTVLGETITVDDVLNQQLREAVDAAPVLERVFVADAETKIQAKPKKPRKSRKKPKSEHKPPVRPFRTPSIHPPVPNDDAEEVVLAFEPDEEPEPAELAHPKRLAPAAALNLIVKMVNASLDEEGQPANMECMAKLIDEDAAIYELAIVDGKDATVTMAESVDDLADPLHCANVAGMMISRHLSRVKAH